MSSTPPSFAGGVCSMVTPHSSRFVGGRSTYAQWAIILNCRWWGWTDGGSFGLVKIIFARDGSHVNSWCEAKNCSHQKEGYVAPGRVFVSIYHMLTFVTTAPSGRLTGATYTPWVP